MPALITIIEQISPTEVIVACARCQGSGRIWPSATDSKPCWVCRGKGKLLVAVERLPLVECARCKGSGREWAGASDSAECVSCGGAGCQPVAGEWRIVK